MTAQQKYNKRMKNRTKKVSNNSRMFSISPSRAKDIADFIAVKLDSILWSYKKSGRKLTRMANNFA